MIVTAAMISAADSVIDAAVNSSMRSALLAAAATNPLPACALPSIDIDFITPSYFGVSSITSVLSTNATASRYISSSTGAYNTQIAAGVLPISDFGITCPQFQATNNLFRDQPIAGVVAGSPGVMPLGWWQVLGTAGWQALTRTVVGSGVLGDGRPYVDIQWAGTAVNSICNLYISSLGYIPWTTGQARQLHLGIQLLSLTGTVGWAQIGYDETDANGSWLAGHDIASGASLFSSTLTVYNSGSITPSNSNCVSVHPYVKFYPTAGNFSLTLRFVDPYFRIVGGNTSSYTYVPETITIGGALSTALQAAAGTVYVEFHQVTGHKGNSNLGGSIIKDGSVEMVGMQGHTTARCGAVLAPSGIGGILGLNRAALSWSSTGVSICYNGGRPVSGTALASRSTLSLLNGLNGFIRRIVVWPVALSDDAIQSVTGLNVTPIGSVSSNYLTTVGMSSAFNDDFATLDSNVWRSPQAPFGGDTWASGTYQSGNQECAYYVNASYPNWQGYTPFSIVADDSGVSSSLRITAAKTSTLSSAVQAVMADRSQTPAMSGGAGGTIPYTTGWLSSAAEGQPSPFTQQYGLFAARIKAPPNVVGAWPAFWLMAVRPDGVVWPPELDVIEFFQNTENATATEHWGANGSSSAQASLASFRIGYDMSTDYHEYAAKIDTNGITAYVDGLQVGYRAHGNGGAATYNFGPTGYPMYFILSQTVGSNSPGFPVFPPDSSTPNTLAMDIDRVTAFQ